jgi:putative endonuclease
LAVLGERLAADFLIRRGAHIVARNLRVGRGEIDLVVGFGGLRAAVEVKTSQTGGLDDPSYAFTVAKARQVRRLAGEIGISRIDLVAVKLGRDGVGIRWAPHVA